MPSLLIISYEANGVEEIRAFHDQQKAMSYMYEIHECVDVDNKTIRMQKAQLMDCYVSKTNIMYSPYGEKPDGTAVGNAFPSHLTKEA